MASHIFCFERFRLMARERVLLRDDMPIRLGGRAFDLLLALVERGGETVNRDALFKRVWPDVIVAKVNLRVHVAGLRKALGDGQNGNRFIASVAGRGYCFVADVNCIQASASDAQSTNSERRGLTSVAAAIAHTVTAHFDDALCIVDLAAIDDPAQVAAAVASALGQNVPAQESLGAVLSCLQGREMLLMFANCEHVLSGVAQFTERLLTEAPSVHILVTSKYGRCAPQLAPSAADLSCRLKTA
jgi:DNA-binding winged helix-turn-helix (wHTH) protein